MKVWCTAKEKEQLIKILAKDENACVFSNYICFREDCIKCLDEQIEWHIAKEKIYRFDKRGTDEKL